MKKTRLGITVGAMGAVIYFAGLFGGYLVTVLLAGYILLFEENAWLRRSAVKAVTVLVSFSLLSALINLIPDAISFINNIVYIFNGSFSIVFLNKIVAAITSGISLIETILLIGLGLKALSQGTIVIPVIDKMISNYMN